MNRQPNRYLASTQRRLSQYGTGIEWEELPSLTERLVNVDTRRGDFQVDKNGYLVNGALTITGRQKDLIIIRGRNIWPQDIEQLAETQPEVRLDGAVAFAAPGADGDLRDLRRRPVRGAQQRRLQPALRPQELGRRRRAGGTAEHPGGGHSG